MPDRQDSGSADECSGTLDDHRGLLRPEWLLPPIPFPEAVRRGSLPVLVGSAARGSGPPARPRPEIYSTMTIFIVAGSWLLASFLLGSLLGTVFHAYDECDPLVALNGARVSLEEPGRLQGRTAGARNRQDSSKADGRPT